MLMTPITPNVMARPIAASTSTDPRLRPKNRVSTPSRTPRAVSMLFTAVAAACAHGLVGLGEGAVGGRLEQRREAVAARPALMRDESACTAASRDGGAGIAERHHGQAGLDLRLTAASVSACRPLAQEFGGGVVERSEHVVHRRQTDGRVRIRQGEPRRGRSQDRRRRLLVPIFVSSAIGAVPASLSVSGSSSISDGWVSSAEVTMNTRLIAVANVEPVLEQRGQHGPRARMAGRRPAGRRGPPCRRSWRRAVRRAPRRRAHRQTAPTAGDTAASQAHQHEQRTAGSGRAPPPAVRSVRGLLVVLA